MYTVSGIWVDPLNLDPDRIRAWDIAWPLSQASRYAGHAIIPWTVLSHLGLCHQLAQQHRQEEGKEPLSPLESAAILLHDASEAYLSDIPRPIKRLPEFAFYREQEEKLLNQIYAWFGLGDYDRWAEFISVYDDTALHVESHLLWRDVWADEHKVAPKFPIKTYPSQLIKSTPIMWIEFLKDRLLQGGVSLAPHLFDFPARLHGYTQAPGEDNDVNEEPVRANVIDGDEFDRGDVDQDPILNER